MPIIHVVPAVDERVKVVRLRARRLVLAKSQRRGGARAGVLGTRRTKRNRGPGLVRPNEVDSRYLRAEAFICRGVTEDPYVSTGTGRSADGQVPMQRGSMAHVYAAVGVVLYVKLSLCQSPPRHSLRRPWSPPSQVPFVRRRLVRSLNLSCPGVSTSTPELKISGHPTSGTAANSCGIVKRCERGRMGRTSASRNIILVYCVNRNTCNFVRT